MIGSRKRELFLGLATSVLILSVLVYSTVIEPQIIQRRRLQQELSDLKIAFVKMKSDMLVKDHIEESYRSIEGSITPTGSDNDEMSLFSQELTDLQTGSALDLRLMKFLPATKEKYYRKFVIKIELAGRIRDVVKFISDVESYKKPLKFEQITITAQQRDDFVKAAFVITKIVSEVTS